MSKLIKTLILGVFTILLFMNNVSGYAEQTKKGKILLVISNKLKTNNNQKIEESVDFFQLVSIYHFLKNSHFEPFIASTTGASIVIDSKSLNKQEFKTLSAYEKEKVFFNKNIKNQKTLNLDYIVDNLNEYKGIVIIGGKNSIYDLPYNKALGKIITTFHKNKKPIGAISEGVLGLVSSMRNPDGFLLSIERKNTVFATNYVSDWIYRGYNITCTSENDYGRQKSKITPYTAMKYAGVYLSFSNRSPVVLSDRELVTAQNNKAIEKFNYIFLEKIK